METGWDIPSGLDNPTRCLVSTYLKKQRKALDYLSAGQLFHAMHVLRQRRVLTATPAWDCGVNCIGVPGFKLQASSFNPVASGGDGDSERFCESTARKSADYAAQVIYFTSTRG